MGGFAMTFICSARWTTTPDARDRVLDALMSLAAASRQEPGNLAYVVHVSDEDPGVLQIFENYVDEAAFDAHVASEHFQRWAVREAIPLLVTRERAFSRSVDAV
jgi:quinol monooxygenase YgiN